MNYYCDLQWEFNLSGGNIVLWFQLWRDNSWSGTRDNVIIRSKMGHRTRTPQPQLFRWIVIGKRCTLIVAHSIVMARKPSSLIDCGIYQEQKTKRKLNRNRRKNFTDDKSDNNIDIQIRASSERTEGSQDDAINWNHLWQVAIRNV